MSANKDPDKKKVVNKAVVDKNSTAKTNKIKNIVLNKARNLKLVNTDPILNPHHEGPTGLLKGAATKQSVTKYTKA